jgi:hypothetical protein
MRYLRARNTRFTVFTPRGFWRILSMLSPLSPTGKTHMTESTEHWRELAQQIINESDPMRVTGLAKELRKELQEELRVDETGDADLLLLKRVG